MDELGDDLRSIGALLSVPFPAAGQFCGSTSDRAVCEEDAAEEVDSVARIPKRLSEIANVETSENVYIVIGIGEPWGGRAATAVPAASLEERDCGASFPRLLAGVYRGHAAADLPIEYILFVDDTATTQYTFRRTHTSCESVHKNAARVYEQRYRRQERDGRIEENNSSFGSRKNIYIFAESNISLAARQLV